MATNVISRPAEAVSSHFLGDVFEDLVVVDERAARALVSAGGKVSGKAQPRIRSGSQRRSPQEIIRLIDRVQLRLTALRKKTIAAESGKPLKQEAAMDKGVPKSATRAATPRPILLDDMDAMIGKGQLIDSLHFQELMGWTRQSLSKALLAHRVFYVYRKSDRYFPAFFGDLSFDRKKLEQVTKVLGDLPGSLKLQFFVTRKGSLAGDTPLQALATGGFEKVLDVAATFAEVPAKGQ
ncbi:MAG: hypothetical protein V4505_10820 [Pseudomonadota bacterium]